MTSTHVLRIFIGALTICMTACGAKVVVDSEGIGGAGGGSSQVATGPSSGSTGTSSNATSTSTSSGPGSTSSGTTSTCDLTGNCETCVSCATTTLCADLWNKCTLTPGCMELMKCLSGCPQNEPMCLDKCLQTFPDAIDLYKLTAACVVCQGCFNDCNGSGQCP